ncbi:MAG: amino acid permease, partial [Planctomycetales bacterium]|nr:amino acid permease [Planctomycetales bacterium]
MALHSPDSSSAAQAASSETKGAARPTLSLFDSVCVIVGIIIGSGIYMTLPSIAHHSSLLAAWLLEFAWIAALPAVESWLPAAVLCLAWLLGAGIAVSGALCYAELASAFPHHGGDYHYLTRAYGRRVGFFFVWCEFWIVRPANVGAVALVFSEYGLRFLKTLLVRTKLAESVPAFLDWIDDPMTRAILALLAILALTGSNLMGVRAGIRVQNTLSVAKVIGLTLIV